VDDHQQERRDMLPEHEMRDAKADRSGGILGMGGTAVDRGTGTLEGQAQGEAPDVEREDEPWDATRAVDPDGMPAAAFDRRTMEAEGGEAERDDTDSPLDSAFSPRSG
jgi:hypothetical protein